MNHNRIIKKESNVNPGIIEIEITGRMEANSLLIYFNERLIYRINMLNVFETKGKTLVIYYLNNSVAYYMYVFESNNFVSYFDIKETDNYDEIIDKILNVICFYKEQCFTEDEFLPFSTEYKYKCFNNTKKYDYSIYKYDDIGNTIYVREN